MPIFCGIAWARIISHFDIVRHFVGKNIKISSLVLVHLSNALPLLKTVILLEWIASYNQLNIYLPTHITVGFEQMEIRAVQDHRLPLLDHVGY